jgi:hypothetical protein
MPKTKKAPYSELYGELKVIEQLNCPIERTFDGHRNIAVARVRDAAGRELVLLAGGVCLAPGMPGWTFV